MHDHKIHNSHLSIDINEAKRLIVVRQRGVLDRENAILSLRAVHEADGFDPAFDTITDYSMVSEVRIDFDEFMPILEEAEKTERRTGRNAIIVGDNTGRMMLAKVFCEMSRVFSGAKIEYRAFTTIEEACAWLSGNASCLSEPHPVLQPQPAPQYP